MKLHRLELTGFGPFREKQVADFDAFDGDGVFLISGRTGAGKSSILDGVSFALYGAVPRYDGGERRLRSDHCFVGDPTEVRLEFTVGDSRWRVTRAPEYERPAKRGGGLTAEPQRAELEQQVDGQWVGRAAKPRTVAEVLDEILGLNAQQFQQVILLAQNKFSRFLLARNDERQALLRTLFGTRRFEDYKNELDERRREAQKRLDTAGEHAQTLLGVAEKLIDAGGLGGEAERPDELTARREAAQTAQQRAAYRVEARTTDLARADAAAAAATAAHAAMVDRAKRLAERAEARQRLAALEAGAEERTADRARLDRARAAEALRATLDAARRADAARAVSTAAQAEALRAWADAGGEADADLEALIDGLTGDLARWHEAAQHERDLVARETELAGRETAETELTAALTALEAQQALVPAQRAAIEAELAAARATAVRQDAAHRQRDLLAERLDAAREADRLDPEVQAAEAAYLAAGTTAVTAATAVTSLLQRRVAGYAGELAGRLAPGEPCEVCGSTEHPHPAAPGEDPVTDDDLAAAEQQRESAAAAEQAASETARRLREARAAAVARIGDLAGLAAEVHHDDAGADTADAPAGATDPVALLTDAVAAAQTDLAAIDRAVVEADALTAALTEFDELSAAADAEKLELTARRATVREEIAGLRATIASLRAVVADARGDHDSVADRVAAATRRRDLARALHDAQRAAAERDRAHAEARADCDGRIAASVFDDVDAATAALLDEPDQKALDTRLGEHAAALAAARARLLELELDVADAAETSAAELAAAAEDAAAADRARTAAIGALREAEQTAARLRELLVQVDEAYVAVSVQAEAAETTTRLADTVAGRAPNTMKMDLETFVLAAELEEIVAAANLRLTEMSSGRYTLHHSDARQARGAASGLGIDVLDAHTGRLRPPQSLSGGETFLASLALALGLAEVVTSRAGGIKLDTLFVDEGFGSLDPETLELAMRTLDELRVGGRTVGVISHVEAMKEQLPARLIVTATADGPSVIAQDAAITAI